MRANVFATRLLAFVLFALPAAAQWTDFGGGVVGWTGHPIGLVCQGTLEPGSELLIWSYYGPQYDAAFLIIGASACNLPFKGGVMVPQPDHVSLLGFDGLANAHLFVDWPAGVPAGSELWWQVWSPDATAAQGWSASNALKCVTP